MSIIEYYTQVIENMGLTVSEDGYIYVVDGKDKSLVMSNGKPLVLPTKDHIESIYSKDEDGNPVITKLLFNPLNEDVVKGDSESFKKIKNIVEYKLGHLLFAAGELLLTLGSDKKLQGKTNLEINKFLSKLNKANNQGIKAIIDDKSLDHWCNIYKNCLAKSEKAINIFVKKKGKVDDVNYVRVATLSSNIYEALSNATTEISVYGVKLRNKDITVFKSVFEYLIEGIEDEGILSIGSNNGEAPAFLSLFSIYLRVMDKINKVFKYLTHVDKKTCEHYKVDNLMTEEQLEDITGFKSELSMIPNETDLSRTVAKANRPTIGGLDTSVINKPTQQAYPTTPVTMNQPQQQAGGDPLMKALYGQPTQPVMQQAMAPQPIGLNSIPMQQPVYNMPMYQQPMMQPVISNPASYYQQPVQPVGLNTAPNTTFIGGSVGFGN